jgi:hypothetical protein
VIVRLMGEGQWRIEPGVHERLNELDEEAMAAIDAGDEATLDAALERMWALVKEEGERLPDDELSPSDVLVPPSDLTLEETRLLIESEGLIPDLPT